MVNMYPSLNKTSCNRNMISRISFLTRYCRDGERKRHIMQEMGLVSALTALQRMVRKVESKFV